VVVKVVINVGNELNMFCGTNRLLVRIDDTSLYLTLKELSQMDDQHFEIVSAKPYNPSVDYFLLNKNKRVGVWLGEKKKVVKLQLSNGFEVVCTSEHILKTRYEGALQAKNCQNLQLPYFLQVPRHRTLYAAIGYIQGLILSKEAVWEGYQSDRQHEPPVIVGEPFSELVDGFGTRMHPSNSNLIYFKKKENIPSWLLEGVGGVVYESQSDKGELVLFSSALAQINSRYFCFSNSEEIPLSFDGWSSLTTWSLSQKNAYLSGLFTACGDFRHPEVDKFYGDEEVKLSMQMPIKMARCISDHLKEIGIGTQCVGNIKKTETTKEQGIIQEILREDKTSLEITGTSRQSRTMSLVNFHNFINFLHGSSCDKLARFLIASPPKVEAITEGEVEDVYDFSEPRSGWGVIEGIAVHNCNINRTYNDKK